MGSHQSLVALLAFELRQVRGSRFDLLGIHPRRDSGHRTGLRGISLGARLEFAKPIDYKLCGFGGNARKASTVTFTLRGVAAETGCYVPGANLGELLSREHEVR